MRGTNPATARRRAMPKVALGPSCFRSSHQPEFHTGRKRRADRLTRTEINRHSEIVEVESRQVERWIAVQFPPRFAEGPIPVTPLVPIRASPLYFARCARIDGR